MFEFERIFVMAHVWYRIVFCELPGAEMTFYGWRRGESSYHARVFQRFVLSIFFSATLFTGMSLQLRSCSSAPFRCVRIYLNRTCDDVLWKVFGEAISTRSPRAFNVVFPIKNWLPPFSVCLWLCPGRPCCDAARRCNDFAQGSPQVARICEGLVKIMFFEKLCVFSKHMRGCSRNLFNTGTMRMRGCSRNLFNTSTMQWRNLKETAEVVPCLCSILCRFARMFSENVGVLLCWIKQRRDYEY